jgi:hypothetical protein
MRGRLKSFDFWRRIEQRKKKRTSQHLLRLSQPKHLGQLLRQLRPPLRPLHGPASRVRPIRLGALRRLGAVELRTTGGLVGGGKRVFTFGELGDLGVGERAGLRGGGRGGIRLDSEDAGLGKVASSTLVASSGLGTGGRSRRGKYGRLEGFVLDLSA